MRTLFCRILAALALSVAVGVPCTRIVYRGPQGRILTGRTMDWTDDIVSNLWIFPRGVARTGEAGPASARWSSKYGSITTSGYDICTTDGLNEAGLSANLLWLVESEYPQHGQQTALISMSLWAQYMLDNFGTVKEAVDAANSGAFTVLSAKVPGQDSMATLHLSLSDASGDSAIMEYLKGKLVIHHGPEYQVMTNSPAYDEQLALVKYWKEIGGTVMLPGTNRAADRFARASFYVNAIPQVDDRLTATAGVFSICETFLFPWESPRPISQTFPPPVGEPSPTTRAALITSNRPSLQMFSGWTWRK